MQLKQALADQITSAIQRWEKRWKDDETHPDYQGGFASHGHEPRIDDGEYDLSNNRKPDFIQADDAGWEA